MNPATLNHYISACESYYLKPGYIFVVEGPYVIQTVLGSCISVCLYDPQFKLGGMNHFLLPDSGTEPRTPRFGQPAMQALLENMVALGAQPKRIVAQIFGGASMPGNPESQKVAAGNVDVAREFLGKAGIDIQSEDTGGFLGRKILFLSELNQALIYKLEKVRREDFFDYRDTERESYGKFY